MMGNFFRVAALILIGATGVYLYELGGGTIVPAEAPKRAVAVAVSKSPPPRLKSTRTIDRSRPMPQRPAGLARMIEAKGGSDFPVLIPHALARDEAMVKRHNVRLRLTDDGYTSVLTMPDYDVVIYGTRSAYRKQATLQAEAEAALNSRTDETGPAGGPLRTPVRADYTMSFEDGDDGRGGSISFGRYGVDYHIEFFCHGTAEACIDEKAARTFLKEVFKTKERATRKPPSFRIDIGISGSTTRSTTDPSNNRPQNGPQKRGAGQ